MGTSNLLTYPSLGSHPTAYVLHRIDSPYLGRLCLLCVKCSKCLHTAWIHGDIRNTLPFSLLSRYRGETNQFVWWRLWNVLQPFMRENFRFWTAFHTNIFLDLLEIWNFKWNYFFLILSRFYFHFWFLIFLILHKNMVKYFYL